MADLHTYLLYLQKLMMIKNLLPLLWRKNFQITIGEENRIKGSSTVQVFFSDCMVPKENILGDREGI